QHCPARRDMPTMAEIFIAESGVHRTSAQAPSLAFLAEPSLTFPAVFGRRMAEQPEAIAFYDVPWGASGLSEPRPMTYRHLGACAARAATLLGDAGVSRGDRVLLCVESRETFFAFFLGAEALGAVPVPLPAASEARLPAAFRERIVSVAGDCAPKALVADDAASLAIVESDLGSGVGLIDASRVTLETAIPPSPDFDLDRSFEE